MTEDNLNLPYRSQTKADHACGHDVKKLYRKYLLGISFVISFINKFKKNKNRDIQLQC